MSYPPAAERISIIGQEADINRTNEKYTIN